MKTFLWYKRKVLFSSKIKVASLIIMPIIYLVICSLLKVDFDVSMFFGGISIPLVYTYVLFTVGDLNRVTCFIAAGEKPKHIWLANMIFIALTGFLMSTIFQGITILVFKGISNTCVEYFLITLCEVPLVTFFVGLSTLHFRNNTHSELIFSSFFSVLNAFLFFLPMLSLIIKLTLNIRTAYIIGIVGLIGTIILNIYMNSSDNETLVINTAMGISSYDKALLGLDAE